MQTIAMMVLTIMIFSSQAWAHDESMHKQKATHGRVTAVKGEALTLRTETGPVAIVLTDATRIEQGSEDVGRDALKSGAEVAVYGTTVPGEGLVAKEIVLEAASGESEHDAADHSHIPKHQGRR